MDLFQVFKDNLTIEKLLIKLILLKHLEENIITFIDMENTFEKKAKRFLFSKSFIKIRTDRLPYNSNPALYWMEIHMQAFKTEETNMVNRFSDVT